MKTAIVSGVGPLEGLGAQLCLRFASLGLHVLAAGRTEQITGGRRLHCGPRAAPARL